MGGRTKRGVAEAGPAPDDLGLEDFRTLLELDPSEAGRLARMIHESVQRIRRKLPNT